MTNPLRFFLFQISHWQATAAKLEGQRSFEGSHELQDLHTQTRQLIQHPYITKAKLEGQRS
jgi:hypothetical protein